MRPPPPFKTSPEKRAMVEAAIRANNAADEPLTCAELAKSVGVSVPLLFRIARGAKIDATSPQVDPASGVLLTHQHPVTKRMALFIGIRLLRRAKLHTADRLAYRAEPGRLVISLPEAKP